MNIGEIYLMNLDKSSLRPYIIMDIKGFTIRAIPLTSLEKYNKFNIALGEKEGLKYQSYLVSCYVEIYNYNYDFCKKLGSVDSETFNKIEQVSKSFPIIKSFPKNITQPNIHLNETH